MKKKAKKTKLTRDQKEILNLISKNVDLEWDKVTLEKELEQEIEKALNNKCTWIAPFAAGCFITFVSILIISLYFS